MLEFVAILASVLTVIDDVIRFIRWISKHIR